MDDKFIYGYTAPPAPFYHEYISVQMRENTIEITIRGPLRNGSVGDVATIRLPDDVVVTMASKLVSIMSAKAKEGTV